MNVKCQTRTSKGKTAALAVLLVASVGGYARAADMPVKAMPAQQPVPFFSANNTSVSFTYYPDATDPGVAGGSDTVPGGHSGQKNTMARYQASIDHFDAWEYGTNLFHVELNQYGDQDPNGGVPGAEGSRELYAFERSTIGLNELTHSSMFSNPFFKDMGIEGGGTYGFHDSFLASQLTEGLVGVNFRLNLPGTVLFAVLADQGYSHSGFDACGTTAPSFGVAYSFACTVGGPFTGDRNWKMAPKLEFSAAEPLDKLVPLPLTFYDVTNVTFPKGTGISTANCDALAHGGCTAANLGINETKTEILEDVRLTLDASKQFFGKPGIWDTYVGYRYWYNKFGANHNVPLFSEIAPGSAIESTAYMGTTYHFK